MGVWVHELRGPTHFLTGIIKLGGDTMNPSNLKRAFARFVWGLAFLFLASLACNVPGFTDDNIGGPEGDHVSDEELRAEIDATYDE